MSNSNIQSIAATAEAFLFVLKGICVCGGKRVLADRNSDKQTDGSTHSHTDGNANGTTAAHYRHLQRHILTDPAACATSLTLFGHLSDPNLVLRHGSVQ